jgi:hypothetical protein
VSFLCFPVYANSVIPRVGPCPPLPPSPPLRPFGLLRGHCRATLALLWLCLNHYCTPGGGLKTVMLVPPPPANRLYSSYVTITSLPRVILYLSNSWNKYFYCFTVLLFKFLLLTKAVVCVRAMPTTLPEAVDPSGDGIRSPRTRPARIRPALAAAARASATRLKTSFLPAATMASPEKRPERMDGARRGGGSNPALLFLPSASWLGGWAADG